MAAPRGPSYRAAVTAQDGDRNPPPRNILPVRPCQFGGAFFLPRSAPTKSTTAPLIPPPAIGGFACIGQTPAPLKNNKRPSRALPGASALSHEQSKRPELGRAPQTRIRGKEINVGKIQNLARRGAGRHRETTAAPSHRHRESRARGAA